MTAVVIRGDAARLPLPDASVDLIVTSPPYFGLRSYTDGGEHYPGQIGSEGTPGEYVAALVGCTAEWVRVLKPSGSLFVNLGDKYSGYTNGQGKGRNPGGGERTIAMVPDGPVSAPTIYGIPNKSLMGLPWRYALAATDQLGLILRAEIIWAKPNGLPESVTDRVRRAHEQVFHFTRQPRYYTAVDEIREDYPAATLKRYQSDYLHGGLKIKRVHAPDWIDDRVAPTKKIDANPLGKLPGSVWTIPSQPLAVPPALGVDHFAAFPMELPRRIILGWSPPGICTGCGEGRRPVTDKQATATRPDDSASWNVGAAHFRTGKREFNRLHEIGVLTAITGYACSCPQPTAPTRRSVVVDPFGGTGTTALIADTHGRLGISIDRSHDYTRLAKWRTRDPAQRAQALQVDKPSPVPDGQEQLFEMTP
jgi:DNA modification methylase